MAITYPLTPPAAFKTSLARWTPVSVVGVNASIYTGQQQVLAHSGNWWDLNIDIPVMKRANADEVEAFLLALNGPQGTFTYGDRTRLAPRGTRTTNTTTFGAQVVNGTTLVISGTGTLEPGDWVQIGVYGTHGFQQLVRVVKRNSSTNYDVFPRLRAAYAAAVTVTLLSPTGLFRLRAPVPMDVRSGSLYGPYTIPCREALT